MSVLYKVEQYERNLEIEREKRDALRNKYTFQQQQKQIPGASYRGQTINVDDVINYIPSKPLDSKEVNRVLQDSILKISGNNSTFTRESIEYLNSKLSVDAIQFINNNWEEIKKQFTLYRSSGLNYITFSRIIENFVTRNYFDFDSANKAVMPSAAGPLIAYDPSNDPNTTETVNSVKQQIQALLDPNIANGMYTQNDFDNLVSSITIDPYVNIIDMGILYQILNGLQQEIAAIAQNVDNTTPPLYIKRNDVVDYVNSQEPGGGDIRTLNIISNYLYKKKFDDLTEVELDTFLQDLVNDFKLTFDDSLLAARDPNAYVNMKIVRLDLEKIKKRLQLDLEALLGIGTLSGAELDDIAYFISKNQDDWASMTKQDAIMLQTEIINDPVITKDELERILGIAPAVVVNPLVNPLIPSAPSAPAASAVDFSELQAALDDSDKGQANAWSNKDKRLAVYAIFKKDFVSNQDLYSTTELEDNKKQLTEKIKSIDILASFKDLPADDQRTILSYLEAQLVIALANYNSASGSSSVVLPVVTVGPPAVVTPATTPDPSATPGATPGPITKAKGLQMFKLKNNKKPFKGAGSDLQSNLKDKYYVDMKNLNSNVLKLKYKSFSSPVPNFPPVKISDNVKNIVINIIHNHKKEANKLFGILTDDEKKLIKKFCSIVECEIIDDVTNSKQMLMKKYEVLAGEIHAGNDSKEIQNMLKNVVIELYDMKYITKLQYLDILHMIE